MNFTVYIKNNLNEDTACFCNKRIKIYLHNKLFVNFQSNFDEFPLNLNEKYYFKVLRESEE